MSWICERQDIAEILLRNELYKKSRVKGEHLTNLEGSGPKSCDTPRNIYIAYTSLASIFTRTIYIHMHQLTIHMHLRTRVDAGVIDIRKYAMADCSKCCYERLYSLRFICE